LELPPIEKGRPVAGRPFCFVEKKGGIRRRGDGKEDTESAKRMLERLS
jgi:hypothetical protein